MKQVSEPEPTAINYDKARFRKKSLLYGRW